MTTGTGHTATKAGVYPLPGDVIKAFAEALHTELSAGRAVRIRRLGMWTPYTGENGKPTVVFHSEINLRNRAASDTQKGNDMSTTDVDIPFVKDAVQAHKARPPRKEQLIDVQLLFDEVREEFGLNKVPAAPEGNDDDQTPDTMEDRQEPADAAGPPAQNEGPAAIDAEPVPGAVDRPEPEDDAAPLNIEELQESEDVFRMNRDRLFNPPEPRKPNGMRIAAMVMTALMLAMLGYMAYSSGMLNGILPENLKYHPTPLERRLPRPVPPGPNEV